MSLGRILSSEEMKEVKGGGDWPHCRFLGEACPVGAPVYYCCKTPPYGAPGAACYNGTCQDIA